MFTRLSLVSPHAKLVVTTEEIRSHLFITHSDDDLYLTSLARVATAMVDGPDGLGISIAPATYRLSLDSITGHVDIPLGPVTAVESVTVNGEALDPNEYRLETDRTPARVYFGVSQRSIEEDGIKIVFTAGYETIPQDLKQAALLIVGHLYRNREATSDIRQYELPLAVESILSRYRA